MKHGFFISVSACPVLPSPLRDKMADGLSLLSGKPSYQFSGHPFEQPFALDSDLFVATVRAPG
jgi:hypothetical protein